MGWRFPKHLLTNPQVIEIDDVNEDFRAFVEEASGALNEHNWRRDAFNTREMLADDAAVVLHTTSVESDPNIDPTVALNTMFPTQDVDWETIDDLEVTFNTTGGTYWILMSLQASAPFLRPTFLANGNGRWGLQFALSLNEAVLAQSIVGSGDLPNDAMATFRTPSPPDVGFFTINSPGITSRFFSLTSEAVVEIPPGRHTIRGLVTPPKATDSDHVYTPSEFTKWLGTRELILIELLR